MRLTCRRLAGPWSAPDFWACRAAGKTNQADSTTAEDAFILYQRCALPRPDIALAVLSGPRALPASIGCRFYRHGTPLPAAVRHHPESRSSGNVLVSLQA